MFKNRAQDTKIPKFQSFLKDFLMPPLYARILSINGLEFRFINTTPPNYELNVVDYQNGCPIVASAASLM
jgi:hypothetical protein